MDTEILCGINAVVLKHIDQEQVNLQGSVLKSLLRHCKKECVNVYYLLPYDGSVEQLKSYMGDMVLVDYREEFGGLAEKVQIVDCKLQLAKADVRNIVLGGRNLSDIYDLMLGSLDGDLPSASIFGMMERDYMNALRKSMRVIPLEKLSLE